MAAEGRASPGAGEGEEMAGAVSGRAIPRGASGPVLGRGEQLGGVMKVKHPPHGRERQPGAGARAPFREIWRVGAVAFPRRPNVGRRLWSLTKENP